jgi:DNA mismatch endonuclease (patch repair protein)
MSKIRSKNTSPELILKKQFKSWVYQPKEFGKPDFIDYKKKLVVFIDGCFWHKCPIHGNKPKSNKKYWLPKLERNVIRDREVDLTYKFAGWKTKRIWEHELGN